MFLSCFIILLTLAFFKSICFSSFKWVMNDFGSSLRSFAVRCPTTFSSIFLNHALFQFLITQLAIFISSKMCNLSYSQSSAPGVAVCSPQCVTIVPKERSDYSAVIVYCWLVLAQHAEPSVNSAPVFLLLVNPSGNSTHCHQHML